MTEEYYQWVRTLKVGDELIYITAYGDELEVKVVKITPKRINLVRKDIGSWWCAERYTPHCKSRIKLKAVQP